MNYGSKFWSMEKTSSKFAQKVMEGLQLAAQKVVEEAKKKGEKIVVAKDGKPEMVEPK